MNYKMIGRLVADILIAETIFMIPPTVLSYIDGNPNTAIAFLITMAISAGLAIILFALSKKTSNTFQIRDGLVSVGVCWIVMSLVGCLPMYISGEVPKLIDALFEMVSGFTTTGASIVPNVESLSRGILYWRSFSHWVGGMGVLVFVLALMPTSGSGSGFTLHLLRSESTGPSVGKLAPKMKTTANILYMIYMGLTVLNFLFLVIGGMPTFDSLCTAFGTAGTGGFGIKIDSLASFSPYIQTVCSVFMILFGVNFSCYYLILIGKLGSVIRDEELRMYFGVIAISTAIITFDIRSLYPTFSESLRHSFFQVSSIITTTGFMSTDFDIWPSLSKGILLCLMMLGACAGSTGGGVKCMRFVLLLKSIRRGISKTLHPQKVQVIKVNKKTVPESVIEGTNVYFIAYFLIMILSFIIVSIDNFSIGTNFSAVVSCLNNIGPGFETVGPTCNYADYSIISKFVLILDMLIGRLEIYPILVLFTASTWKRTNR